MPVLLITFAHIAASVRAFSRGFRGRNAGCSAPSPGTGGERGRPGSSSDCTAVRDEPGETVAGCQTGIALAQAVLSALQVGTGAQALGPFSELQQGAIRLG